MDVERGVSAFDTHPASLRFEALLGKHSKTVRQRQHERDRVVLDTSGESSDRGPRHREHLYPTHVPLILSTAKVLSNK